MSLIQAHPGAQCSDGTPILIVSSSQPAVKNFRVPLKIIGSRKGERFTQNVAWATATTHRAFTGTRNEPPEATLDTLPFLIISSSSCGTKSHVARKRISHTSSYGACGAVTGMMSTRSLKVICQSLGHTWDISEGCMRTTIQTKCGIHWYVGEDVAKELSRSSGCYLSR